ncbi:ABC transporter permease [Streptomyces sp. NPDC059639]|uniref:ABC transporter permease n=1 Tax=Streptomyces sp. NPDC059639 TaxID=3346891 RepID=UPI0036B36350
MSRSATEPAAVPAADGSLHREDAPSPIRTWTLWTLRRVGMAVLTLWLISLLVFTATHLLGDPAEAILGRSATPARLAALRSDLGLDRSAVHQYFSWLGGVLTGDFGTSLATKGPVSALIGTKIANSAVLVAVAAVIIAPLSALVALYSARRRDTAVDHVIQVALLGTAALPEFVIGILLVTLFSTVVFTWLPSVAVSWAGSPWTDPVVMILPVATLTLAVVPYVARILRASLIEVLESDYVEMARLKGVPERRAVARHALGNAVVPAIQVMALQLAWLAGGVVVVESLFLYPGIGTALVDAVRNRDVPVIQALALLIAAVYVVVNLIADVLTILVTPKLRTGVR